MNPLAIVAWMFGPVGRYVTIGVVAFTVGFTGGWRTESKLCNAANMRAQIAALKRDLAIQRDTAQVAQSQAQELQRQSDDLNRRVDQYEAERAKAFNGAACRLSPDDVRRLRDIR
jgi:hypothetical protein